MPSLSDLYKDASSAMGTWRPRSRLAPACSGQCQWRASIGSDQARVDVYLTSMPPHRALIELAATISTAVFVCSLLFPLDKETRSANTRGSIELVAVVVVDIAIRIHRMVSNNECVTQIRAISTRPGEPINTGQPGSNHSTWSRRIDQ